MGNFLNAYVDLGNTPSDSSARQVILSDAGEVASRFSSAGQQIEALQTGVTQDLTTGVAQVNSLSQQIAQINGQIAALRGSNQPPNDLLDKRDQLVKQISQFVKVSTIPADDGSLGVFIAGGQSLVLGTTTQNLQVTPDASDPSRSALSLNNAGTLQQLQPSLLVGGSLSGLIQYQNTDLVAARNQVGQMAAAFAWQVNQVQGNGLNMRSPATAGAAIFSVGGPVAIPNTNNARTAGGGYATTVSMNVTDGTQLQASDYSLKADPANPGNFIVTRESDGVQFSMVPDAANPGQYQYTRLSDGAALGNSMDGFQISFSGAAPTASDSFELQPVGTAASDMTQVLTDPAGIAAASPVTATLGANNTGTASVASLSVVNSANYNSGLTAAISFSDNTGDYNYTLTDSSGNVTASGTGTWSAGQPISLNGFALNLSGVPKSGDTINVANTQFPASNNGNVQAMVNLGTKPFVGQVQQLNGSLSGGQNPTDAYAAVLADVGVRVQSAQTSAQISDAASQQADTAVSSAGGVNLDEEAANLIQYQQGYQAAAKVLQVAQSVFDTMLQVGQSA